MYEYVCCTYCIHTRAAGLLSCGLQFAFFLQKSVLPIVANYKQLLSPSRLPNCSPSASASALTILITMPQTWHAKVVAVAVALATVAFVICVAVAAAAAPVALLTSESNNWCTLSTIFCAWCIWWTLLRILGKVYKAQLIN